MNSAANKLQPKMRFPEFLNDEKWDEKTIDSLGKVITGGTPSKEEVEYWDGDFVWVTAQDFSAKYITNSVYKLTQKGKKKSRLVPKNSILVTCIASIGLNAINKVECATNQQINSIVCNTENYFEFVYYAISHNINRLKSLAGQTAVPIINKSLFEKFIIQTPKNPAEQQKIANCLTSLDQVIEAQTTKLSLLKTHKKGLLQNLFPKEGETLPKYRFKEFEKDVKWAEEPLGQLSDTITKKVGEQKITLLSINAGVGLVSQIEKFGREIAGDSYKNYIVINKEDFAYNKSSTKFYPEGQISMLEDFEIGAVPNSIFTCFKIKKEKISPYFLKYLFEDNIHGKWLRKYIAIGARANGALNIDNKYLISLNITYPKNHKEQQKIANTLSSLDDLIKAQIQKIDQLKAHKKGLMQGLFPNTI